MINDFRAMIKPPLSTGCHIYKVPYHLRKLNEEAYTPHVISIGPIHHDKKNFKPWKSIKQDTSRASCNELR